MEGDVRMESPLAHIDICFIGAGSMAEAIIRGLLNEKKTSPARISVVNRHDQNRLTELHHQYGVRVAVDPATKHEYIRQADMIVLAMKPNQTADALQPLADFISPQQMVVSVIAGLSVAALQRMLGKPVPIARSMPNTSSTIGLGATGVSFSEEIKAEQRRLAIDLFESIGVTHPVAETQLDIVTGLSGSGPAYIYYIIEAMIEAGVAGGLSEQVARSLTVQTVLGAAQMVNETGEDPGILRRKVTSPGGTTEAALALLEERGVADSMKHAVNRAAERAQELGIRFNASSSPSGS